MNKLQQTAKIKLNISADMLRPTVEAYTEAYNFCCGAGFANPDLIKNKFNLHKKTYSTIREYLTSQLSCSAENKAVENLKAVLNKKNKYPSCPFSKQQSIRYDNNSYSLFIKDDNVEVSLSSIFSDKIGKIKSKRLKTAFIIPTYYKELFSSWRRTSAELIIRKNKVYLHICFEKETPKFVSTSNSKIVGIDRGQNNIAVLSNNIFFSSVNIEKRINRSCACARSFSK